MDKPTSFFKTLIWHNVLCLYADQVRRR